MAGLSDATRERLASLVRDVVAPPCRAAGFAKRGLRWCRAGDVTAVVDLQRAWGDERDLTTFTLNWGLDADHARARIGLPPVERAKSYTTLIGGRVGSFADDPRDLWWEISAGTLAPGFDPGLGRAIRGFSDAECEHEVKLLVHRMIDFLDQSSSIEAIDLLGAEIANGAGVRRRAHFNQLAVGVDIAGAFAGR